MSVYSTEHVAAYAHLREKGWRALSEREREAIAREDPAMAECEREQERKRQAAEQLAESTGRLEDARQQLELKRTQQEIAQLEAAMRGAPVQTANAAHQTAPGPARQRDAARFIKELDAAWDRALAGEGHKEWAALLEQNFSQQVVDPKTLSLLLSLSASRFLIAVNNRNRERQKEIDGLKQRLAERDERLEQVERRIADLEAKPSLSYRGIYEDGRRYMVGDCVTRDGSLWVCKTNHIQSRPGIDVLNWQLCVKRGRDGKDLRADTT